MGIVPEDVERVKAQTDVVQIISEHVQLRRVGRRFVWLCPFHAEKSGSFNVNAELGFYHCFGCQASGDVITFLREVEHLDFVGAVEKLAARANISLRYDDETEGRDRQAKARLADAVAAAVEWYHQRLLTSPDARAARDYLRSRGIDGETARTFKIGWAPDEWDALSKSLRLPSDVLSDSGLGFVNKAGRQQDTFRARILFPIFDAAGHPVAFGGRILPGADGPKYKNSADNKLYSKSRVLYGLNWSKTDVARAGEVVVCEGYTDVIGFHRAGVPRAVATCGTALTGEHFRILKNFARRIVLAYDADAAGQKAAEQFYEWERSYEIDLHVLALPKGADPADVATRDPEALVQAVAAARPFLAFRIERVLGAADLSAPEGRARAANAALDVIAEHPDAFVRDQYFMQVADRCRVDVERLRQAVTSRPAGSKSRAVSAPPAPEERTRPRSDATPPGSELEAVRLAVHAPELVVDQLHEVLFEDDAIALAVRALFESDSVEQAIESAAPEAAALLRRIVVEEPPDVDADDVVARLVERAAGRVVAELERDVRADVQRFAEIAPIVSWLRLGIEELRDPDTRKGAADRLVPWLARRAEEIG